MTLFHITAGHKVNRILDEGILPKCPGGISQNREHTQWVWLTDNPKYILQTQAGQAWARQNKPVILTVDVSDLIIEKHVTEQGEIVPHEFKYNSTIEPGRIKLG